MDKRSALIVATDTYADAGLTKLRAPGADAEALAGVLGDPDIGGFDVESVVNQPAHQITRSIAQFFADRRADDLLLLHMSCHGVKDDSGELYFAAVDTSLDLLEATGVSSSFVNRVVERSRAGRVLLFLDCCYSGAFAHGLTSKSGATVDISDRLGGKGRAVITASSALQFAFEGQQLTDGDVEAAQPSLFTSALVRGLQTGDADRDQDGWVALDELYAYVHDEVARVTPKQKPQKWAFEVEGDLYVARRGRPVTEPSALPSEIAEDIASLVPWTRLGVVEPLRVLLTGEHPGRAFAARLALEEMAAGDDSDRVKQAAREALASAPSPAVASLPEQVRPQPTTPRVPPATVPEEPVPSAEYAVTPGRRGGRRAVIGAVGAAAVVAAVVVGWWLRSDDTTPPTQTETSVAGLPEKSLLIERRNADGTSDLVAVDTFSGSERIIIDDEYVSNPNISEDRTWMVYRTGAGLPQSPMLARPDGSSGRPLMSSTADCRGTGRPAWSPEGDRLAVVCLDEDNDPTSLRVVTLDGEVSEPLYVSETLRESPTWTGHDTIIFGESDEPGREVTLKEIRVDGSAPARTVLPDDGYWVSQLDWSESGVLFVRASLLREPGDVWLLDPDEKLTQYSNEGGVVSVSWSPDGLSAVYTTGSDLASDDQTLWVQFEDEEPRELMTGALGAPSWGSR